MNCTAVNATIVHIDGSQNIASLLAKVNDKVFGGIDSFIVFGNFALIVYLNEGKFRNV